MKISYFPTRSLLHCGILAVEATNNIQEECPERDIHLQRLARDATIIPQVYASTGENPPPSLSIQHGDRQGVVDRSLVEIQNLIELKNMTALYNYIKRGLNKLPTRRFVPVDFKKPCTKKDIVFSTRL